MRNRLDRFIYALVLSILKTGIYAFTFMAALWVNSILEGMPNEDLGKGLLIGIIGLALLLWHYVSYKEESNNTNDNNENIL